MYEEVLRLQYISASSVQSGLKHPRLFFAQAGRMVVLHRDHNANSTCLPRMIWSDIYNRLALRRSVIWSSAVWYGGSSGLPTPFIL